MKHVWLPVTILFAMVLLLLILDWKSDHFFPNPIKMELEIELMDWMLQLNEKYIIKTKIVHLLNFLSSHRGNIFLNNCIISFTFKAECSFVISSAGIYLDIQLIWVFLFFLFIFHFYHILNLKCGNDTCCLSESDWTKNCMSFCDIHLPKGIQLWIACSCSLWWNHPPKTD